MNWFVCALICIVGWGFADLFYKKGTDESDRYSHLKIAVWVGLVMGVAAFAMLPFSETSFSLPALIVNAAKYSPASLCYIISMVIGYAGLRYLEVSIVSPVQNASGAMSAIFMMVYFLVVGRISSFSDEFDVPTLIGTVFIVVGVIALAVFEQRYARAEELALADKNPGNENGTASRKYRFGALALLFPLLYCLFDTLGTAADGIILDEEVGLGLGEIDVLILYGLTFFLAGIVAWVFLWIKEKKPYNPFVKRDLVNKGPAALCEEFGQVFYVFAMAGKPIIAAPMVASYCIVSLLLGRLILKEKLRIAQYACVAAVVVGIVLLGISEGLAEGEVIEDAAEEVASLFAR
ncbi:MAG: EamA family transporter [Clostridia bacterium]|nr:EamA family transporter [Clostridia bacterium]MBR5044844.1 EamA family transporter [Clostridia bacterium]